MSLRDSEGPRPASAERDAADFRLELLAHAGDALARSLDRQETLDAIARTVVPRIADWCRVDLIDDAGHLQRAVAHHADPARAREGWALVNRLRAAPGTVGSMAWAAETGHSHLAHFDPPAAYDAVRDRDLLTFAQAIGMRAYYVVPLVARGRTLGAMAALQAESGRGFRPADCAMLDDLGQRAALALDNARLYAEAEAARREAERANRTKDEFLGILGHELRNPLAPIVMALHVMKMKDGRANVEERRIIERQVAHLSRLVDDLLDVSRITQGKIELRRDRVNLADAIGKALELTQPMFEKRTRPIELDVTSQSCIVSGDEVRLAQVVSNLLINAAKFTPDPGRIVLRLCRDGALAKLEVVDEGIGIQPELLPFVFDVFVQGAQPLDRMSGGLGLGLAIVRMLVRLHDGTVGVSSEGSGRGSRFTVTLPLVTATATTSTVVEAPPPPRVRSGRVLIVDDNADAAAMLAVLLEVHGFDVAVADDGIAAIERLVTFVADVAILDIGLPGMNGYELADAIARNTMARKPRLIALTGYGTQNDRDRALRAGFDEHLVKPVEPERLLAALDRVMAGA